DTEDKEIFTYVLQAPFSPGEFMRDTMFRELLYREIGENKFASLNQLYQKEVPLQHGTDITVAVSEIYETVEPQSGAPAPFTDKEKEECVQIDKMDLIYLQQVLVDKMIPVKKNLTDVDKRVISEVSQLYHLDQ